MTTKKTIKENENKNSTIKIVEKKENIEQEQKNSSRSSNLNNSSSVSNNLTKNLKIIQENIEARLKTFVNSSNIKLKKLISIPKLMEASVYIGLPSFL